MLKKEFQDGSSTLLYGSWGERVEVGNTYAFSQLKVICSVIVSFSVPSFCFKCLPIKYCRKRCQHFTVQRVQVCPWMGCKLQIVLLTLSGVAGLLGRYHNSTIETSYGSVSAGREKWPFNVLFFLKVEPPCDQT